MPPALLLATLGALAPPTLDAPISAVTVFSDRARVTRSAALKLAAGERPERVELPLLGDSVDPSTIWVQGKGVEVRRVEIAHVEAERFPADEARSLLAELDALDDEIARTRGARDAAAPVRSALLSIAPVLPSGDPLRPPPKLNPAGWSVALRFLGAESDKLAVRVRALDRKLEELGRKWARAAEKARTVGGARRRSGWRVTALVAGGGPARLELSYVVGQARWYPTYDIQLQPERGQVQIAFAGRVSQESGEDWKDAALTLSTAIPATAVDLPELATWKIGQRERFIPTPVARPEPFRAAPPVAAALEHADADERLRTRLLERIGGAAQDEKKREPETVNGAQDEESGAAAPTTTADVSKNDELRRQVGDARPRPAESAHPPAPPPPPPEAVTKISGSLIMAQMAPSGSSEEPPPPTRDVGLLPPPGWRAPVYSPDLPAALAGGYDLAFPSLRNETVASGKGPRRVALFAESWPVSVERKIYPALAREAFLVAEIKNPSKRALPGGEAHLFVGADPAGTAQLKLVAPSESFTLPLGLDRAVKVVRNVKLVESEKGFFSKDDVGDYQVTIEIANPYRAPLAVRLIDQVPLAASKDVEVKLGEIVPGAARDAAKGTLEWRLTVGAGAKQVVKFAYRVRRPKGWRLYQ
jgi:hypothetical protein